MNEKLYDSQFTARWRSYFWKINKECFIPLPFDLSEIAHTNSQTILPYVQAANVHIKKWHWPRTIKSLEILRKIISGSTTFARVLFITPPLLVVFIFGGFIVSAGFLSVVIFWITYALFFITMCFGWHSGEYDQGLELRPALIGTMTWPCVVAIYYISLNTLLNLASPDDDGKSELFS